LSQTIGLTCYNPQNDGFYVSVQDLEPNTLFDLDMLVRSVASHNKAIGLNEVKAVLAQNGFVPIEPEDEHVYFHSRPWDEHQMLNTTSFFVTFPESAPYELRGELILATTCPNYYSSVSADHLYDGPLLLLNKDHEPIYSTDQAWRNEEHEEMIPIGGLIVPIQQFSNLAQLDAACLLLAKSGYNLFDS
jgi:hypothetical protein